MKKELKKIANELMKLELQCQNCNKNEQNMILEKMAKMSEGLSLLDMLEIDQYIQSKL